MSDPDVKIYPRGEKFRLNTTYSLLGGEDLPKGLVLVVYSCGPANVLMNIPGHAKYDHELVNIPRFHLDSDIFERVGAEPKMPLPRTLVSWYSHVKPHVEKR